MQPIHTYKIYEVFTLAVSSIIALKYFGNLINNFIKRLQEVLLKWDGNLDHYILLKSDNKVHRDHKGHTNAITLAYHS